MRGPQDAWITKRTNYPDLVNALRFQGGGYVFIYENDELHMVIDLLKVPTEDWKTYSDWALMILKNLKRYSLPTP